MNKFMVDVHGYCIQESTIKVLHLVKDERVRNGIVMKFNITTDLFLEVQRAHGRYIADLEQEKARAEKVN